jgi:hypothetical protein
VEAAACGRRRFRARDLLAQALGQPVAAADDGQTRSARKELSQLYAQIMAQQLHERAHFVLGPAPVVAGERKQRELGDAEIRRRFDDAPRRGDARPVSGRSRQTATQRPAAVAVHDNGDVKALFALQSTLHCKVHAQKN